LALLVAVATANPDFCAHIPANQRVNQVAAPLRDWCFYTVAFDTQDIRVCDRMTPSAVEGSSRQQHILHRWVDGRLLDRRAPDSQNH
jgi:hypothetical protein